jgi:hypothetical protein
VDASDESGSADSSKVAANGGESSGLTLTPTLSLVSTSLASVTGTTSPSTPAMSLGFARSE